MNTQSNIDNRGSKAQKMRSDLTNTSLVIFSAVIVPVWLVSLLRIQNIGIQPIMYLHAVLVVAVLTVTYFRKQLPYSFRAYFIIWFLMILGTGGVLKFGLSGNGVIFLFVAVVLSAVLINRKTASRFLIVCLLIILCCTALVYFKFITFDTDFNAYNAALANWLTFFMVFLILGAVLMKVLGQFNRFLFDLVANLENHVETATHELKQANKVKSEFLANMSHEIRTPMNGVLGMLRLIAKTSLNEDQRHKTNLAKSSAESLLSLINDILDFSKAEAGKMTLEIVDFNLASLFGEIAEANALKAQQKEVELVLDLTEVDVTMIKADPSKIRQVVTNLLGNAIKFTAEGTVSIVVRLKEKDSQLRLQCDVIDSGIGIPKEKLTQLFNVFTQADNSTTRKFGGTGLGLSICRKLCHLMDGDVNVTSEVDRGSCFSFDIKVEPSERAVALESHEDLSGHEILIVDSNPTSRKVLEKQLKKWGVSTRVADTVETAMAMFEPFVDVQFHQSAKNDISQSTIESKCLITGVIIDNSLVQKNGGRLLKLLVNNAAFSDIRIIMMTDFAHINDPRYFKKFNVKGYFPKPATTGDLLKALQCITGTADAIMEESGVAKDIHQHLLVHENDDAIDEFKLSQVKQSQLHLLIVEDNFVNQQVILGILDEFAISANVAENGREAIETLKHSNANKYHLVLMDCQMPELDGYQATAAIREGQAGDENKKLTIIAMTANAMQGDREKCLDAGMDDYLSKPVEPARLLDKLYEWHCDQSLIKKADVNTNNNIAFVKAIVTQEELVATEEKMNDDVWDKNAALKRLMNKEALLQRLVDAFMIDLDKYISDLEAAVNAEAHDEIRHHAHTLKGTSSNIGGVKLQHASANLEQAAKNEDTDKYLTLFATLNLAKGELAEVLTAYRA